MKKCFLLITTLLCIFGQMAAQTFYNLTADEVRLDSVLPVFSHSIPLPANYQDSAYSVSIDYPEFIDMQLADVERFHQLTDQQPGPMPEVSQRVARSRGTSTLDVNFVPLVCRDGKYQKLVSFKLTLHSQPVLRARQAAGAATSERYAAHSVLATGQWAKISVPETGIYQLTEQLVRQAGFTNINKVKIYGYGGALQPERLTEAYLTATDDLQEVPTCVVNGRRLFHGVGPVGWSSAQTGTRTRNPYADYGCYFLTESDDEPMTVDSAAFVTSFYPTANDYHVLHEVDDYAWYHTGRNLFQSALLSTPQTFQLNAHDTSGQLVVAVTCNGACSVSVMLNDSLVGNINVVGSLSKYARALERVQTFNVSGQLKAQNTVRLQQTSGTAEVRLDYLSLTLPTPAPLPQLSTAQLPQPTFVYRITNQDHHADDAVDLVIIIPTTQKLLAQAERLKQLHEEKDGMRVRIVPADELFNEFSSGTPDANAYRRYLKMLYDRAETEADMPRYLLLFGDGAWDNRMLSADWRSTSPDDFLLCYESEDSFSETDSYVSDDYFGLLDDGEQTVVSGDKVDVGVGRLPARTSAEAKIMVDKIVDYANNRYAGAWQNTLCFLADDGNNNAHMYEANSAATEVIDANYKGYDVKKIFMDAYTREASSTGFRFPDVEKLIRQQMQQGALVIDYCGHGAPHSIAHEKVLLLPDFDEPTSLRLPLWITCSCDIMPFDTQIDNIGETAMLNPRGGSVAFFGTTRTVFVGANKEMNCAFLKYLLGSTDGRRNTMGDAVRLSKNELRGKSEFHAINKLHYTLLGDPALTLAAPTRRIVVDSIDGQPATQIAALTAGKAVTVNGHIEGDESFDGVVTITVKDVAEDVVCKLNNPDSSADAAGSDTAFVFVDRVNTFFSGTDNVKASRFSTTFVLPRDISYNEATGLMTLYALSNDKTQTAHGENGQFTMSTSADGTNDGTGPSIYCYLNSSSFVNGGNVNTTPYFFAELTDNSGINASGSSVGHDLELVIDGLQQSTYNLNDYFQYDFGDYRSGTVGFSIPTLSEGSHKLLFRAWDVFNNSSVSELTFNVVKGLEPQCFSVDCTRNPATTATSFIVTHDRAGATVDVALEVYDTSGRLLWQHAETGVPTDNTYTLSWDLTVDSGRRLQTGVYLYRVLIGCDGSRKASKAKKLIILNNN